MLKKEDFIEIFKTTSTNPRGLFLLLVCCIIETGAVITGFMQRIPEAITLIVFGMCLYMIKYMRDSWYMSTMLENTYIHDDDDYTIRYKYVFNNNGIDLTICHRYAYEKIERHIEYRDLKKIQYSKNYTIITTKDNHFLYFERDSKADNYFSKKLGRKRYTKTKNASTKNR